MPSTLGDLLQIRWASLRAEQPAQPANRALYGCVRQAILDGSLPPGSQLPPSRELAATLGLSRNTTTHAYGQLLAEGYVRSLTGSGTYVNDVLPEQVLWTPAARKLRPEAASPEPTAPLSRRGGTLLATAQAYPVQWGAFIPGVPDVTEFPHRKLQQLVAHWRRRMSPQWLSYATGGGHLALRQAIAHHLRQARSVHCDASQVLVTTGVHQAVDLATRMLTDPGDHVWLEEPGYWGLRGVLAMNGVHVVPAPVDSEGMARPLELTGAPPRLIFVTPSHQYPLGAVMSLRRRTALLDYARMHGCWIVEDDYDSEFRFAGHPIASLQGLVEDAPVIYVGTFSKTMYPGLRIAYAVLPKPLVAPLRTAHAELFREGHLVTQAALADFMEQGHYAAHIRRMRLIYASRRAALLALVQRWLGPQWIHPFDSPAGLHVVLQLPEGLSDVRIAQAAAAQGVHVRALSRYYADKNAAQGLLLGFACVPEADMQAPFRILVDCIQRARPSPAAL